MKAIGYAGGSLYGCKYGAYSVVIAAPNRKTAIEAFTHFLKDHGHPAPEVSSFRVKPARTLGGRPLYWAHVDVTAV